MRYNITGLTMWTNAKGHRDAFENSWLAPKFISQENQAAQAKEQTDQMIAFLEDAGKMYWTKVTKWEKNRCKWKVEIAIKLAKRRLEVTWKFTGTNKPLKDLLQKSPDDILKMALK